MNPITEAYNNYAADLLAAERERRSAIYSSGLPEEIINNLLSVPEDGPDYGGDICG